MSSKTVYDIIFRKNSTMALFIVGGAILGEMVSVGVIDNLYDSVNCGV
jgi:hypothetical protein